MVAGINYIPRPRLRPYPVRGAITSCVRVHMAMLETLYGVTCKLRPIVSLWCHSCMVVTSGPISRTVYIYHIYI